VVELVDVDDRDEELVSVSGSSGSSGSSSVGSESEESVKGSESWGAFLTNSDWLLIVNGGLAFPGSPSTV